MGVRRQHHPKLQLFLHRHRRHERRWVVDDSPGYDAPLGARGSLRAGADGLALVLTAEETWAHTVRLCRLAEIRKVLIRFLDDVLLREADVALERLASASAADNSIAAAGAALTAIVAAASTIEAYLSEVMAHLEDAGVIKPHERQELKAERHLWKKWNRLARMLGAEPTELSDTDQYRALIALVTLRNVLVHRSADFLPLNKCPKS